MDTKLLFFPEELDTEWLDAMRDINISTLGLHPRGGIQADEHLSEMLLSLKTPCMIKLLTQARQQGMRIT